MPACPADPCLVVVLSAHRQARVSRMPHSRIRLSSLAIKQHSSVARWLERERQTDTSQHYDLSIFCLARGAMAKQIADKLALSTKSVHYFCVMAVIDSIVSVCSFRIKVVSRDPCFCCQAKIY